jgi:hypothetical protein
MRSWNETKCLDNEVYNETIQIELRKTNNENKNDIVSQKFEIYLSKKGSERINSKIN